MRRPGSGVQRAKDKLSELRQRISARGRAATRTMKETKMDKKSDGEQPIPDVDRKTAEGKGEGGCSPHPDTGPDKPAPFDPHAYRPNVEPPAMKPVGKKDPNKESADEGE